MARRAWKRDGFPLRSEGGAALDFGAVLVYNDGRQ